MRDESSSNREAAQAANTPQNAKVSCFVCKRNVDQSQAKQEFHPKHREVWVCEAHLK